MGSRATFGIRFKMALYFTVLLVVLGVSIELIRYHGIPFTDFKGARRIIREEAFRNFSIIADMQKDRLLDWINGRKNDIRILSESIKLREYLTAVTALMRSYSEQGNEGDKLWQALQKEDMYEKLFNDLVFRKNTYAAFSELIIVDKSSGRAIVSTNRDNIGRKIFENDTGEDIGVDGFFIDISRDATSQNTGILVIAYLIEPGRGAYIGVNEKSLFLVAYVRLKDTLDAMFYSAKGLGLSGEIVSLDQGSDTGGEEGIIESLDRGGMPVLAAYRYIRLSPRKGFGMVVKRDREEVFGYLADSRKYSGIIYLFGILLGVFLVLLISGNLMRPIELMADAARRVEADDFSARVDIRSRDEIGLLAVAFNKMMERVAGWKEELERQIAIRIAELAAVNQQLRAGEQQLQATNQQLRAANEQMAANEKLLRAEIERREKMEKEIQKQLHELQVFYKSSIGREGRILELKNRIKELEEELKKR